MTIFREDMRDVGNELLQHPNFTLRDGMAFKNGRLELEHPCTVGWLMCLLMRMAPRTTVKPKCLMVRTVQMDGKMREERLNIEFDEDGNRLIGAALAEAVLMMWDRRWDMVFDDPLSAHSLGAAFLAMEHY
jgi:hypothetical protein